MALHGEINPSDLDLLLGTGLNALEVATGLLTRRSGGVWIDTGDGSGILAGGNASDGVNRVDKNGVQLPLVDTSGIDKAAKDAQQKAIAAAAKADEAIAKGEQIRRDAQAGIDDVRKQAQDSAAKADGVRSDLESQTTALKSSISAVDAKANQVKAAADKISQRVDADKAALDKSIADVDAKAQAASDKGDKLAGQIGDVTTTVNGHTTKLDALSTRIEGVASDGQATTKSLTSLRQTVTGLSSTVSQSTKTASDAMSKATQVEQTANGISANLSKNYTSTAESNKKYAAKTELKTTAEGLQANITKSLQTADGAVTAASKAQATADGINATLSKDYQTAKDSDAKYSTKAELKATSNELSSSLSSVRQMADGAVTAASKAQQTADGISANLSKNYATKSDNDATYATQTSLKATSDSLAASINSNAKTAQGAVDKATNLEANLNGFKTTVADTYQSKGIGDEIVENGIPNPDRPNKFCLEIVDGVFQRTFPGKENHVDYGPSEILHQIGPHRTIRYAIDVRLVSGKDTVAEGDSINAIGTDVGWFAINVKLKDLVDGEWHSYEAYQDLGNAVVTRVYMSSYVGSEGAKVLQFRHVSVKDVTSEHKTYSTKSELTQTANSIKAEVTEVSQTATGAMSKVTTLEQTANGLSAKVGETARTLDATVQTVNQVKSTADSNKATISQVSTTANDALSRTPSLEQNLSGFKTEVSSTYATKSDLDNRPSGSNLWCNQLFDPDKPQITSLVDNVTAPNGSRVNLLAARDNFNPDTSFPVIPGRTYVITAYCKQIKGGLPLHAGIWYTHLTSGPAYEGFVKAESTTPLGDGWMAATWRFACPAGKSRGCVYFQIDNWPWDSGSTQWYVANVTCTDVTGLQPAGDYATNSSLMQTANQIRGEVSERYQSKNGMSSYATTSALTQKADEITGKVTEVAKTAQGNTTTISQVSQKVDRINTTLSQQIGGKADTSRVSSLEQNLDGFKSTVAATYQTKGTIRAKPRCSPGSTSRPPRSNRRSARPTRPSMRPRR
ncbi:chromosome segregation protein SMC [Bifidobacterium longum subsp. infantis]|nr:chromosome segregation protein SMC [Bifidobacterium longum subsp. infantis]